MKDLDSKTTAASSHLLANFAPIAVLIALTATVGTLHADSVVAPPAERSGGSVLAGGFDVPSRTSLLTFGPVRVLPSLSYRRIDSEGLLVQPGDPIEKTTISMFSPDLLVTAGERWQLQYSPVWSYYSSDRFQDAVENFVRLRGSAEIADWRFSLTQTYESTLRTRVETGRQTDEDRWLSRLEANVRLNSKVAFDTDFDFSKRTAVDFASSTRWSITEWLNYQFSPRLTTAIGLGRGAVRPGSGNDTSETTVQARLRWRPSDRTTISINSGFSRRSFDAVGAASRTDPVFGATVQLRPFPATTLALTANRSLRGSYFSNSTTDRAIYRLNLTQRLLGRLYLATGLERQETSYIFSTTGANASRSENLDSFNIELRIPFRDRLSLSTFYRKTDNASTDPRFDFSNRQTGFSIALNF